MNAVNLFAPCHGFKTLGPEKYLGFYFYYLLIYALHVFLVTQKTNLRYLLVQREREEREGGREREFCLGIHALGTH